MSKTAKKTDQNDSEPANLEKVRDLLFGAQLSEVDSQINTLKDRFNLELKNLESQTQANLESLQQSSQKEQSLLKDRLVTEKTRRESDVKDLKDRVDQAQDEANDKIHRLEDHVADVETLLTRQIFDEISGLRSEMNEQVNRLQDHVDQLNRRLSNEKVQRGMLAALFRSMAAQLDSDPDDISDMINQIATDENPAD